jgi:hypothetical protein
VKNNKSKVLMCLLGLVSFTSSSAFADGNFVYAHISNASYNAQDPAVAVVNYTVSNAELVFQSNHGMPTGCSIGGFCRFNSNPNINQSFTNFRLKLTLAGNGPGAGSYEIPISWGFNGSGDFSVDVFTKAWPNALEKKVRFNVFGGERWIYF